jgi:hypothetical protein
MHKIRDNMKKQQHIQEEVEKTLNSLDGIKRAEPKPFFYTRLQARMEQQLQSKVSGSWSVRPVYAFATLAIVFMINIATIVTFTKSNHQPQQNEIESFAKIYGLDNNGAMFSK